MAKIYDLMQERAKITKSMRDIMEEHDAKEMPAEIKAGFDKLADEFDALNDKIIAEQKQLDRERAAGEVVDPESKPKDETISLFAKALSGEAQAVKEYRDSFSLGDDGQAGSLTAPMEFREEIIKGLDNLLFMRRLCRKVGPIGVAQSLGYPYRKTEASDITWLGEVAAAPEETTLDYGRREFKPYRMAKLVKISRTLARHAPIAPGAVRDEIVGKVGVAQEYNYLNGDGTSKPLGIFVASNDGIPTSRDVATGNTATAVTFEGLVNARYALKQQYWPNANWILHRDLAKAIALIQDGEGRYIWQGSVVTGQPDRLLGSPVNMSEYAPNTYTAGLYAAVLGDFSNGYWICDAEQINIQPLLELFAVNNQVGYLVDYFGDGAPVIGEAFVRVKMAAN